MNFRNQITLISFLAVLLVVVVQLITIDYFGNEHNRAFSEASLHGARVVWEDTINQQYKQLKTALTQLSNETILLTAIANKNLVMIKNIIEEKENAQKNSHATLQWLITDVSGNVLYPEQATKSKPESNEQSSGIQRKRDGTLVVAFSQQLYQASTLVGNVSLSFDMKFLAIKFAQKYQADTFLVAGDATLIDADNPNLYAELGVTLPPLGVEKSMVIRAGGQVFDVVILAVRDINTKAVAYMITVREVSKLFAQNTTGIIFSAIIILASLIMATMAIFLFANARLQSEEHRVCSLIDMVHKLSEGDLSVRATAAHMKTNDKISHLAVAFSSMAANFQNQCSQKDVTIAQKNEVLQDIRSKSEMIERVVGLAAHGDFSREMVVCSGGETIDNVANSIAAMLDGLNELIGMVQLSGIQVTSSATEIAATAKQQEATVSEQAATVNEIMSNVQDISGTSRELVNTMNEVVAVAENTAAATSESQNSLLTMEKSMHQMMDATESIGSKLAVISEKTANINTVVTTITKVADQTNLLSLNAAIEAEKAGEYGAGFSVVATEIRRLADQTAVATWDIEQMVKEMQSAVSAGVMGMDKFSDEVKASVDKVGVVGAQLADIIEQVQTLIPRFEIVHGSMQSQSLSAEQITESMVQLNETAQQTAESLCHSNDAIVQLNDAAQLLQDAVSRFRLKA